MIIVHDHSKCYSCKACQLACSYHHTGSFWPEKSSIRVSRNTHNGKMFWQVDSTCYECKNEEKPFCVKFCIYGAMKLNVSEKQDQEAQSNG